MAKQKETIGAFRGLQFIFQFIRKLRSLAWLMDANHFFSANIFWIKGKLQRNNWSFAENEVT